MGEFRQNTWAAGLERLLLGVTMDETDQHFIGTTLPLDDVDAGDVDLVGRLAELVARVNILTAACNAIQPLEFLGGAVQAGDRAAGVCAARRRLAAEPRLPRAG